MLKRRSHSNIIEGQKSLENKLIKNSNKIIFCDTNVVVTQIWSQCSFSDVLNEAAKHSKYDYYLLTDVDIPWQNDYLRDRPNDREKMLNVFKEVLDLYDFPYKLISGDVTTRIKTSVEIIDKLILKS